MQQVSCDLALHGVINDGTAIGMGISNAVSRLKESKAKSKVIILLTDGSNNSGEISPLTAADIAATYGIRIYTIGVGTNGTAPFPYPLPGGGVHYIQMPCEIDTQTLSGIATATGGQFYRANSTSQLKKVYHDIDTLERTKFSVRKYSKRYDLYQPLAMLAILSLLIEILFTNNCLQAHSIKLKRIMFRFEDPKYLYLLFASCAMGYNIYIVLHLT